MSVIKSLVIAFSMYSKIPMPHLELEEKDMRYVMGFFPLAGLVIGAVIYGWVYISGLLNVPDISRTLVLVVIPALITGGIHMSNLLANECSEENGHPDNIFAECMQLYSECSHLVIVTNEVFSDGCEYDDSTTDYIRRLGELNVKLAKAADTVVEVVYTIPVVLKGDISYVGN